MSENGKSTILCEQAWGVLSTASRLEILETAVAVGVHAGNRLNSYLNDSDLRLRRESADLEIEQLIRAHLTTRFPVWGFRAEEEPERNQAGGEGMPFWLVDPNDGTSSFLKGERGSSVSIALISEGRPVLGVIFAYAAPNGKGDLFTWAEGCGAVHRNGVEIYPEWKSSWGEATLFVSNRADRYASAYQTVLKTGGEEARYRVAPGIAYRLALCAVGEGEAAISLASPRDFDMAAGHALLIGSGGVLLDGKGLEVHYHPTTPQRLGAAFGGAPIIAKTALSLNWTPTFTALTTPQKTPFLRPELVQLCSDANLLDSAQGAWWGWHIGHALCEQPSQNKADVENALRTVGGDRELIKVCRSSIQNELAIGEDELLQQWLELALDTEAHNLELAEVDENQFPTTAIKGARWGYQRGRRGIPTKWITALLSWREGEMDGWQPDGDRLVEQLLALNTDRNQHEETDKG